MNSTATKEYETVSLPVIYLPPDFDAIFPRTKSVLNVARKMGVAATHAALRLKRHILLLHQKVELDEGEEATPEHLHAIGAVANIIESYEPGDGTIRIAIAAEQRAIVLRYTKTDDFLRADVQIVHEEIGLADAAEPLMKEAKKLFSNYAKVRQKDQGQGSQSHVLTSEEVKRAITEQEEPGHLADTIAGLLNLTPAERQAIIDELNPIKRLQLVIQFLKEASERNELRDDIHNQVRESIQKTHREFYLQEQMKVIQKELGRDDIAEVDELREQVKNAGMSEEAEEKALKELDRLAQIPPQSAESGVIRTYVDWILALPWKESTEHQIHLPEAERILDEDHYGLEKPKENVLEYLAVLQLVKHLKGPIICLVGPPGVGKTSLGKSVARATGRKFVRMSLGGVRDEAEIRGHRRTYIGAIPGRIIQGLRDVKSKNPLFLLDEIDKLSSDFRGDPASALLEVLDPEQNATFRDHYMDIAFDLSDVMFITTANTRVTIPPALEDRMEIIELPGYTDFEKHKIATFTPNGLIPKQLERHGLSSENITFTDEAIFEMIHKYTREAGVRSLERTITTVMRKIAKEMVTEEKPDFNIEITPVNLSDYLGPAKWTRTKAEESDEVGVATGMVWTQIGGDIVSVEATTMPGEGKLSMTGQLQEVMRESVQAAVAYIRSRAESFGISKDQFEKHDIHIHIPEGAVPKDGPSAGITVATAILSALTGKSVRKDVAMTGEITLRGRVLPIGGLKEKALAAYRNGIFDIIIPSDNEKDEVDIPTEIREGIRFHKVNDMIQVLEQALREPMVETEVPVEMPVPSQPSV
ncbi:MAG: endopeptidase La [Candidatus Poribacteria bacterium]|nr:endopeptidase La [Candidatus Poribacteria bacterium]MYK19759.1 endopeptidase La [Candidatus Poribacteria bacterium]